jgi:ATP/maltotriose-dependent transcriptional regulator MalT
MVLDELAQLQALRGELEDARASLDRAKQVRPQGNSFWIAKETAAAAVIALASGDPGALRQVVDADTPAEQSDAVFDIPQFVYALWAEADLAVQARSSGDHAGEREALTRTKALIARVQELSAPDTRPLGGAPEQMRLEVELCHLDASRAHGDAKADAWAANAAGWERLGQPFRAAYAHLREAEAALAENLPRTRVTEPLAAARSTATQLGARPLLREIDGVSRRARIRSAPEDGPAEVTGLTARELDVLRLMAAGHTNPQIGKALYMSPKTASVHVSRILAKLDVKTRTEAAGVAHRLGLLDVTDGAP